MNMQEKATKSKLTIEEVDVSHLSIDADTLIKLEQKAQYSGNPDNAVIYLAYKEKYKQLGGRQ